MIISVESAETLAYPAARGRRWHRHGCLRNDAHIRAD